MAEHSVAARLFLGNRDRERIVFEVGYYAGPQDEVLRLLMGLRRVHARQPVRRIGDHLLRQVALRFTGEQLAHDAVEDGQRLGIVKLGGLLG